MNFQGLSKNCSFLSVRFRINGGISVHSYFSSGFRTIFGFLLLAVLFGYAASCASAPARSPAEVSAHVSAEADARVEPTVAPASPAGPSAPATSLNPAAPESSEPASGLPEVQFREEIFWLPEETGIMSREGRLTARIVYEYTSDGIPVSETEYSGETLPVKKTVYSTPDASTPDASTQVLEQTDSAGKTVSRTLREYANGNLVKETVTLPNGTVKTVERYEWDKAGRKILWTVTAQSGDSVSTVYEYTDGVLSRMLVKDASGTPVKRFERTISGGLIVREDEFDRSNRLTGSLVFVYDGTLPVREDRVSPSGALLSSTTCAYDDNGNRTTITYLDRRGRVVETRHTSWLRFLRLVPVEPLNSVTGENR